MSSPTPPPVGPALPFLFGFGQFVRRLLPLAATGLFLAVAWFDLGNDLNVPALFWADIWWKQAIAGLSVCLLIGYVWLLDAMVEARLHTEIAPAAPPNTGWSRTPGYWLLIAAVLVAAGRQFFVVHSIVHGGVDLAVCALLVVWLLAPAGSRRLLQAPVPPLPLTWWPPVRVYLANTWVPLSVLLVLPALFDLDERLWEPIGIALGFGVTWLVAGLLWSGNAWRKKRRALATAEAISGLGPRALVILAGGLFASLAVTYLILMFLPKSVVPPVLSVATLFGLLSGVHAAVWFYGRRSVPVVALLVAGWYLFCNGKPYKLRFPGLKEHYAQPLRLIEDEEPEVSGANSTEAERMIRLCARLRQRLEPRSAGEWEKQLRTENPYLDPDYEANEYEQVLQEMEERERHGLDEWRAYVEAQTGRKPILAAVATSGGANRSALWTAVVLHKLEAELPDSNKAGTSHFPKHVRLIAGASGGMVGAAHYVVTLTETGHGSAFQPEHVASDYLTPVLNATVFREVPLLFCPIATYDHDRGHVLELEMERTTPGLGLSFQDLEAGERQGWRPSLVFTPMLVEDGRRLIVSNLMLPHQVTNRGNLLLGERPSSGAPPAKPNNSFLQQNPRYPDAPTRGAKQRLESGRDVYSREAVELFRLFPDARSQLHVSTVARMNAAFPYVSPAVELPTDPPRSVVDAGYYDNYGVGVAARWLEHHRDWLAKHVAGVVLIQIRDTRSEYRRRHLFVPADEPPSALSDRLHESLLWLTGPPSGAEAARGSVTSFRNDEQLQALSEYFQLHKPSPNAPFFTTVVFERPGDIGMNWYLSADDINMVKSGFDAAPGNPNPAALARLKEWWQRRR